MSAGYRQSDGAAADDGTRQQDLRIGFKGKTLERN